MRKNWTEENIRVEAAKYQTRQGFRRGCKSAYNAAEKLGILDSLGLQRGKRTWTDEALIAEAQKYWSACEFMDADPGAHSQLRRRGLLAKVNFPQLRRNLNREDLFAIAAQYKTRSQFQLGDGAAYGKARQLGLMDEMFSGFREGYGDNDCIYVALAKGVYFNGEQVYKIGVTSARLGEDRLRKLKQQSGIEFEIITLSPLLSGVRATHLEKRLHLIGENPKLIGFSGATEFRALSAEQLGIVLDQISLYSASNI